MTHASVSDFSSGLKMLKVDAGGSGQLVGIDETYQAQCLGSSYTSAFSGKVSLSWTSLSVVLPPEFCCVFFFCLFCFRFKIEPFFFHLLSRASLSRHFVHCICDGLTCFFFICICVACTNTAEYNFLPACYFLQQYLHLWTAKVFFSHLLRNWFAFGFGHFVAVSYDRCLHTILQSLLWALNGQLPMLILC